jgi:pSer/pThr/pTyr-binding forkhead associated (FHA) protein/PAS domain-containing protein
MYRLVCISGQSSARSMILKEGDNVIGRLETSDVRIASNGVSKKHAVIVIKGESVYVTDLGSRNGTFVNGVMVKRKDLNVGDKIAVHDHVFQLVKGDIKVAELSNLPGIDFRSKEDDADEYQGSPRMYAPGVKGDIDHFLDTTVMPFFEAVTKKYSVSSIITVVLLSVIIIVTLVVTIPVVQFDRLVLDQETAQRAVYLVSILAEQNKETVSVQSQESPSLKAIEKQPGVVYAWVADASGRVLASSEGGGDQLPGVIMERVKKIMAGEIKDYKSVTKVGADVYPIGSGRYVVTTPIETFSEEKGEKVYVGFAAIEFSTKAVDHALAGAWQRILVGMAIACFIGIMVALFLSKLFTLPFIRIYDEVDLALKGESKRVGFAFGSRQGMDLIELVNILLRKARRASAKSMGGVDSLQESHGADFATIFDSVGRSLKIPFFVLDSSNSIVAANSAFANISAYRVGDWHGVPIVDAIREQKILGVILNLISRFDSMGQDLSEEVLVNDKIHRVSVSGVKSDRGEFSHHCISIEVV